jgi:uncharacterized protein (DUF433 family)
MIGVEKLYRDTVSTMDVRGGKPRAEGTRIGVHDVIGLFQNGATVDSSCFSDLTRALFYEGLAYYEDHPAEIDMALARTCQRVTWDLCSRPRRLMRILPTHTQLSTASS